MRKSLLSLALLFCAIAFNALPFRAQEQQQRERRVNPPTPQTAQTPSASPLPTPQKIPTTLEPQGRPTPMPLAPGMRLPTAQTAGPKTLEELRTRVAEVTHRPELAPAMLAVKVASLDTGRVLFEESAGKLMMPASNMKIYTVSAALDRLTPDFRWTTSVYAPSKPDAAGTLRGDLIIYGRGDPSIAASFNNGDYFKGINDLAQSIAAAGVKRVEGNLVGDESYFTGPQFGFGWEWDDLQWYYGAPISALTINDNAIDIFVKPAATVGARASVTTGPAGPYISVINGPFRGMSASLVVVNTVTTSPAGTRRDLTIHRGIGESLIEVSGTLPLDDRGYQGSVAIPNPALLFAEMLRNALMTRGISITGRTATIDARRRANSPLQTSALTEIATLQSPPLSLIAAKTLKPSQNLYTELILRTLGKVAGVNSDPKQTTAQAGIEVVKNFLNEAGVGRDVIVQNDGSGLTRQDLITANASVQLLTYMSRHRFAQVFRDALPIAGVDGTLRNRFKGTPAENNLRAKTGTINMVATLSGYVTSAAGERLVFSILLNNYANEAGRPQKYLDDIAVLLASFAGMS